MFTCEVTRPSSTSIATNWQFWSRLSVGGLFQKRNQKTLGNSKCGTWYNYSFNVHMHTASLNSTLHISATLVPSWWMPAVLLQLLQKSRAFWFCQCGVHSSDVEVELLLSILCCPKTAKISYNIERILGGIIYPGLIQQWLLSIVQQLPVYQLSSNTYVINHPIDFIINHPAACNTKHLQSHIVKLKQDNSCVRFQTCDGLKQQVCHQF